MLLAFRARRTVAVTAFWLLSGQLWGHQYESPEVGGESSGATHLVYSQRGQWNRAAAVALQNLWSSNGSMVEAVPETAVYGSEFIQPQRAWRDPYYPRAAWQYLWSDGHTQQDAVVYGTEYNQPERKTADTYYARAAWPRLFGQGQVGETPADTAIYGSEYQQPSRRWADTYYSRSAWSPLLQQSSFATESLIQGRDYIVPDRKVSDGYYNRKAWPGLLWASSFATESLIQGTEYLPAAKWRPYAKAPGVGLLWHDAPIFDQPAGTPIYGTEYQPRAWRRNWFGVSFGAQGGAEPSAATAVSADDFLPLISWENPFSAAAATFTLTHDGWTSGIPAPNSGVGSAFVQPSRRTADNYNNRRALTQYLWQSGFATASLISGQDFIQPARKIADTYNNRRALQSVLWQSSFATQSLVAGTEYLPSAKWPGHNKAAVIGQLWQQSPVGEPPAVWAVYATESPQPTRRIADTYNNRRALTQYLWQSAFATESLIAGQEFVQPSRRIADTYNNRKALIAHLWQSTFAVEPAPASAVIGSAYDPHVRWRELSRLPLSRLLDSIAGIPSEAQLWGSDRIEPQNNIRDTYYARAATTRVLWQNGLYFAPSLIAGTDYQNYRKWARSHELATIARLIGQAQAHGAIDVDYVLFLHNLAAAYSQLQNVDGEQSRIENVASSISRLINIEVLD